VPDLHAYRMSAEMAAAYIARCAERSAMLRAFAEEHAEQHPNHPVVVDDSPFGLDRLTLGFADDTDAVPEGLSRSQRRTYLRPMRGRKGDPWRAAMRRVSAAPKVDEVFHRFRVDMSVQDSTTSRNYRIGVRELDGGVVITCGAALPESPHLTPMRLSEYYAAIESEVPSA